MLIIDCLMESNEGLGHGSVSVCDAFTCTGTPRACNLCSTFSINEMCHRRGAGRKQKMDWPGLQVERRVLSASLVVRVQTAESYCCAFARLTFIVLTL